MNSRTKSSSFAFSAADMPVRFGRYLLLKRRSTDPIGEEFLAAWGVDEGVEQLRVLRAIYPTVAEESQFIALFTEEARSLSRLANDNVVQVMEVGVESGIPFVACEHVEGLSLEQLIELARDQDWPCTWEIAVHVAQELLRGLDHVHRRKDILGKPMGMRHGDLRPANVIVSYDGEIKLTNFGSALFFIADERTNARVQTFRGIYAPPESSAVDEATIAADLWGVATILSALLGGRDLGGAATRVRTQEGKFPSELATFFDKALNRKVETRFRDAASMREALLEITQAKGSGHPPDDLATWTRELTGDRRNEEARFVRAMLGQDAQMSLNEQTRSSELAAGTILDHRYHLIKKLGEGGMGLVFEAEHIGLGRRVAVKVLHERVLDDEVAVARFRREAQITGGLGHPNIIGVSDFGVTEEGDHYLVMDLLEGESLGDRLLRGTMTPDEIAWIMVRVLEGLEAAHQAGVIHRDLKPENIFLTSTGPKIVDFGIAKKTGLDDRDQSLTRPGHICGTAEYLAPEQIRGEEPDLRSDIYAVGIMIYEALAGLTPFRGRTLGETLHKVMSEKAISLTKRNVSAHIPKRLESICHQAIARNPDKRFSSAAEMASELNAVLDECSRTSNAPRRAFISSKKMRYAAGASLVAGLGVAAALAFLFSGKENRAAADIASAAVDKNAETRPLKGAVVSAESALTVASVRDLPAEHNSPGAPADQPTAAAKPRESLKPTGDSAPREPDLLIDRGNQELKMMHFEKAADLFEQALLIDPRVPRAWFGLGRASFERGYYSEAAKKVEYALRLNPGQHQWRYTLGQIYRAMGQPDNAVAEWKRILKTDPDNIRARKSLAQLGIKEE